MYAVPHLLAVTLIIVRKCASQPVLGELHKICMPCLAAKSRREATRRRGMCCPPSILSNSLATPCCRSFSIENAIYPPLYKLLDLSCDLLLPQVVTYSLGGKAQEDYRQGLTLLVPQVEEVGCSVERCAAGKALITGGTVNH